MAQRILACSDMEASHILDQILCILDGDPLLDEVGFIHPSQLMMLKEDEVDARLGFKSEAYKLEENNAFYWSREHKLGISTEYLFPLYKAAKCKFMEEYSRYKKHSLGNEIEGSYCHSNIEDAVMKHSKALLMLSSDFGTAWNARKRILSNRAEFSLSDELHLSSLVLSFAPKSESAWNYRKWVIKRIAGRCLTLEVVIGKESELVEKIAEKSKMNYRAWNHRCWLISYMTSEQAIHELNTNRKWAALHISDNSCFHYRRKLMLQVLVDESLQQLWKDELDWNELLIRRYIGREALWLHRRFLSAYWVKLFGAGKHGFLQRPSEKGDADNSINIFINNEVGLLRDCFSLPESIFEDVQSQAKHSAAYTLWLNREILSTASININQKLGVGDLRTLLNRLCPEKIRVWDCLLTS